MTTVFVELHGLTRDTPVLVNPAHVVAVEGSYIHLYGSGITVRESHAEIVDLFAKALGYEFVPHKTDNEGA